MKSDDLKRALVLIPESYMEFVKKYPNISRNKPSPPLPKEEKSDLGNRFYWHEGKVTEPENNEKAR